MSEITAIQFTQQQARTLVSVSAETLRHWRKTIPYLSPKKGKAARFAFSDIVGLAVTYELVNNFGVQIAVVSEGIDSLFHLLAAIGPASIDGSVVRLTATEAKFCETEIDGISPLWAESALVIPLAPLVAKIQRQMLPTATAVAQVALPFPPEVVRR